MESEDIIKLLKTIAI